MALACALVSGKSALFLTSHLVGLGFNLHWQNQHDKILVKWEEQITIATDMNAQNAVLSQQIAAMTIELKETLEQNKILTHDKWILGQEKAQALNSLNLLDNMNWCMCIQQY